MFNFNAFTADRLLMIVLLLLGILLVLRLILSRRKVVRSAQPLNARGLLARVLRLSGFGLLSLALILAVLLINEDIRTVQEETAPAPQEVDLPADLPFQLEEVTFTGGAGIRLAGWYTPPRKGATIILLHGYGSTRESMLWHAQALVKAGYGVLLYDERASGESGGTRRSYGWEDGPDVTGAIRFLRQREGAGGIGIAGCSIGGQIALQGAIQNEEIGAVWADGPSTIRAQDSPPPENAAQGLVLISNYILDFLYVRKLDIPAPPPMIEQIGRIAPRPVMLVGGGTEMGLFGSEDSHVQHYADFAGPNAQVWVIEEATHCDGSVQRPEEYARKLVNFFDQAFVEE